MSSLLDTILNIEIFAFIGLLVWLYFKPVKLDDADKSDLEGSVSFQDPDG